MNLTSSSKPNLSPPPSSPIRQISSIPFIVPRNSAHTLCLQWRETVSRGDRKFPWNNSIDPLGATSRRFPDKATVPREAFRLMSKLPDSRVAEFHRVYIDPRWPVMGWCYEYGREALHFHVFPPRLNILKHWKQRAGVKRMCVTALHRGRKCSA